MSLTPEVAGPSIPHVLGHQEWIVFAQMQLVVSGSTDQSTQANFVVFGASYTLA